MRFGRIAAIAAAATVALAATAQAGPIVGTNCPDPIGGYGRQMTMTGVESPCLFAAPASGTPQASDIAGFFGGTWVGEGAVNKDTVNGINDLLTITTDGAWDNDVTGTWSIDPSFWATWGSAVISVHVGNGPASSYVSNPDWFLFEVTQGGLGGAFEYHAYLGSGGGLSNFFLWGNGEPTTTQFGCDNGPCEPAAVPEPASLLLFGTGLTALAVKLRRRKA